MNLNEAKSALSPTLIELFETAIRSKDIATWKRLCNCLTRRFELLSSRRRELNDAASSLGESQRAYLAMQTKIQQMPRNRQKEILDMTFQAGTLFALLSMDKTRFEALKKLHSDLDLQHEALSLIHGRVLENIKELGAQQGPGYFHPVDQQGNPLPVYSGPQNPPRKPSGDSDFIMADSECWCPYCDEKVDKAPEDKMKPCEMLVHSKCSHMLGSKVTIPDDPRTFDYGNPKHPHATSKP